MRAAELPPQAHLHRLGMEACPQAAVDALPCGVHATGLQHPGRWEAHIRWWVVSMVQRVAAGPHCSLASSMLARAAPLQQCVKSPADAAASTLGPAGHLVKVEDAPVLLLDAQEGLHQAQPGGAAAQSRLQGGQRGGELRKQTAAAAGSMGLSLLLADTARCRCLVVHMAFHHCKQNKHRQRLVNSAAHLRAVRRHHLLHVGHKVVFQVPAQG